MAITSPDLPTAAGQGPRVAAAAEGAVDQHRARTRIQPMDHLLQQYGYVNR